jgi:hypothetical protein
MHMPTAAPEPKIGAGFMAAGSFVEPRRFGREDVDRTFVPTFGGSGPASEVGTCYGRRVGVLGPGLTCDRA